MLDPEVVAAIMARSPEEPVDRLTAREREVLALMAEGRSNAAIAAALFVTEKAVAKHTNSIFTKLDLPAGRRRQPSGAGRTRLAQGRPVLIVPTPDWSRPAWPPGLAEEHHRGWLDARDSPRWSAWCRPPTML